MISCTKFLTGAIVAGLLTVASLPTYAATACTLDDLTKYMAQCFDANAQLSDYQKSGQAEIVEGRADLRALSGGSSNGEGQ